MQEEAKPWYKSKVILALLAGLIIQLLGQFDVLPEGYTAENLTEFLLIAIPMVVAMVSRLGSTKKVVATAAKAADINNA